MGSRGKGFLGGLAISVRSIANTASTIQTVFGRVLIATSVIWCMHYSPPLWSPQLSQGGRGEACNWLRVLQMELVGKRVLVVGLGRSGVASALFLQSRGARVTVSDAKS